MKTYILLIINSLLYINACITEKSLDITDIILKSKEIADKNFEEDAMGNKYSKSKPWHIYTETIENASFKQMLGSDFNIPMTEPLKELNFNGKSIKKISIINEKRLLANDSSFLVEMQSPFLNKHSGTYATVLWIRDKSWSSGFCIIVEFKIINNKGKFLRGKPLTPTDIQELQ